MFDRCAGAALGGLLERGGYRAAFGEPRGAGGQCLANLCR